MNVTWSDLTEVQQQLLVRLNDGYPHEDSVGRSVDQICPELLATAGSMIVLGLVEEMPGWRDSLWLRLTEAGRRIEDGSAVG
ncbi:hypothetical protein [Aureimonas leprariae]|uniref:MarR family transcriptional regulator n=1 Tax=Plantimonas leprariae TaxID=2615207 RepID=A0A7V7TX05_9HYPH|nr:hypothetical protein [Aureimonas leprariae]KAB0680170.1 hypothetical protein F6X38_08245 [Aureimonas leprariae]